MDKKLNDEITQKLVNYLDGICPDKFNTQHSYYGSYYGGSEYPSSFVSDMRQKNKGKPLYENHLKAASKVILKEIVANLSEVTGGSYEKFSESTFGGTGCEAGKELVSYLTFSFRGETWKFFFGSYDCRETEVIEGYLRQKEKEEDFVSLVENA